MSDFFYKEINFKGSHARKVRILAITGRAKDDTLFVPFKRYVDVLLLAPIVGFLQDKKSPADNETDQNGAEYSASVLPDTMIKESSKLKFIYQVIMLNDDTYEKDVKKRIDKAFKHVAEDKEDRELFLSYVRGGIDFLYDELIENQKTSTEKLGALLGFIKDFEDRFKSDLSQDDLLNQCQTESI